MLNYVTNINNPISLIFFTGIITLIITWTMYLLIIIPISYRSTQSSITKHKTTPNISPILLPLIGLGFGIYIQSLVNFTIFQIFGALLTLCIALMVTSAMCKQLKILNIFATTTFFVLGALCLSLQTKSYSDLLMQVQGQTLKVVAKISNKTVLTQNSKDDVAEILHIDVEKIEEPKIMPLKFSLICYSRFKTDFMVDDKITLCNIKIKKAEQERLSGNTSFQDYLFKEGFISSVFIVNKQQLKLIKRPIYSHSRWLWNNKVRIYKELETKMDSNTFTYFALIFLGNTQHQEITQMRETFNCWGLSHYLARSGLHIVLFILIWTFLFRLIPIWIGWKRLIIILLCIIYKLLSWSSIPFIRAFYVFLLVEFGNLFEFQTNFLHLLSIVCLLILVSNPLQLFFLDFQLSFGLTFALSLGSLLFR